MQFRHRSSTSSRSAAWALIAAAGFVPAASWAAPSATPDGAAAVKEQLERYLGHGPVTVTPAGEAYRIAIDVRAALGGLARFGVSIGPAVYALTAAPQDDGTWHVLSGTPPLLTVRAGDQTTSIVANNQSFDGVFDPRIPSFTRWTGRYDSLSIGTLTEKQTGPGGAVQTRELKGGLQTFTGTQAGDGVIDATLTQSNTAYHQQFTFDTARGAQTIDLSGGASTDTSTLRKLPVRALLDLWAFLLAHPTGPDLQASGAALKEKLRQALPGFEGMAQDGTLADFAVATPFGPVTARALHSHIDVTGLVDGGSAALALKADALALPTAPLPAWAPALLPTGLDLHATVSGYHPRAAANALIDGLEPGTPQPLPPAVLDKAQVALGPRDAVILTLTDNTLTTATFEARFAGEVRMTTPLPAFTITLHVHGLDKAVQAIRAEASSDPHAAQAIAILTLVKGYGKADGEDALSWVIAGDAVGALSVNGVPLPVGPSKP